MTVRHLGLPRDLPLLGGLDYMRPACGAAGTTLTGTEDPALVTCGACRRTTAFADRAARAGWTRCVDPEGRLTWAPETGAS